MADEASPVEVIETSKSDEMPATDRAASRKRRQSSRDDEDTPKRQRIDDDQASQSAQYATATPIYQSPSNCFGSLEPSVANNSDDDKTPRPNQYVAVTPMGWTPSNTARSVTPSIDHDHNGDYHRSTKSEESASPAHVVPSPSNLSDSMVPAAMTLPIEGYPSLTPMTPGYFDFAYRETQRLYAEQQRDPFYLGSLYRSLTDSIASIESAVTIPEEPTANKPKDPVSETQAQELSLQYTRPRSYKAKVKQASRAFDKMIEEPSRVKSGSTSHRRSSDTTSDQAPSPPSNRQPLPTRPRGPVDRKAVAKRLFGGMMQAAAGAPVSDIHQRRAQIEQRQREKLKRQDEEAAREYERNQKRLQQRNIRKQWEYRRSAVSPIHAYNYSRMS